MNKQQLAAKIWQSANKMRSKIEANEYKDYILGFIFYKFLSDKLEKFVLEQGLEKSDFAEQLTESGELVDYIKENIGYFISYEHLFSTWLAQGSDFNIAHVRTAMSAFSRNIADNYTAGTGKRLNQVGVIQNFVQIERIEPFAVKARQHLIDYNQ